MKKIINAPERVVEEMLRGMELAHGGYVRPGMLDAACAGAVFTSPAPDQVLEATKAVDDGAGAFYVIKNYTGDVLMELYVAYVRVRDALDREGVSVWRMPYVGDYMTSLEMAGFSITLLKLDDEMKGYLEAPCNVAAGRPF